MIKPRKMMSQNFATTVGVLVILAIFGLGIGIALFTQNQERGSQHLWFFQ